MTRKILFLFILLPFVSACAKVESPAQETDISTALIDSARLKECLESAGVQYSKDWVMACDNTASLARQKLDSCEAIHFPWKQQNISRDQYCRNTTVETLDPSGNYRNCMENIVADVGFNIAQCMGTEKIRDRKDCILEDIFANKLEQDKKKNIENCNN